MSEIADRKSMRWFAVQTHANHEHKALHHLGNQGFVSFLPMYRRAIKSSKGGGKSFGRAAFFPCYIFVEFDPRRDRWLSVNNTIGVKSLVMQGEKPLPVPHGVVEQLQAMTDDRGYLRLGADLGVGDDVRVMDGPFAEMMGRIERLDGKHRVQILIEMIHGRMAVSMPRDKVAKAALEKPQGR